jgi:hypothetical protein
LRHPVLRYRPRRRAACLRCRLLRPQPRRLPSPSDHPCPRHQFPSRCARQYHSLHPFLVVRFHRFLSFHPGRALPRCHSLHPFPIVRHLLLFPLGWALRQCHGFRRFPKQASCSMSKHFPEPRARPPSNGRNTSMSCMPPCLPKIRAPLRR